MKFRFVDRITAVEAGRHITGVKAVSLEEYFLQRGLGFRKHFPATLMLETLLQLGNYLIYETFHTKLALLTLFRRVTIGRLLTPGEVMTARVDLISVIGDNVKLSGTGYVGPEVVIRGEGCVGALIDLERLADPGKFQRMYRELCRGSVFPDKNGNG